MTNELQLKERIEKARNSEEAEVKAKDYFGYVECKQIDKSRKVALEWGHQHSQKSQRQSKSQWVPLTRSKLVFSNTSTIFSNLVLEVKMKSSSTHSTYLVVTWEIARLRPANHPCGKVVVKVNVPSQKLHWKPGQNYLTI